MALKQIFKVRDNHAPLKIRQQIAQYLESNNNKNLQLEIKIQSKVSSSQYGYLFAVVYPVMSADLSELYGEKLDIYDIDLMMKLKFWNKKAIDYDTGELHTIPNTKTAMNKGEMAVFIDSVIKWCSDKDIIISEPYNDENEYDYAILEHS